MVTAQGLAQQGAQVTVVDREEEVLRWPRAMVYLPSTIKGWISSTYWKKP